MLSEERTVVERREEREWEEKVESKKSGYWVRGEGGKQEEWILKKRNPVVSEEYTAEDRREEREWEEKVES